MFVAEWFYQMKGDMALQVLINNRFRSITIRQGQMFLLPAEVPHSPQRSPDSLGHIDISLNVIGHTHVYRSRC